MKLLQELIFEGKKTDKRMKDTDKKLDKLIESGKETKIKLDGFFLVSQEGNNLKVLNDNVREYINN